jgi:glycosyltransferase 2 family protein
MKSSPSLVSRGKSAVLQFFLLLAIAAGLLFVAFRGTNIASVIRGVRQANSYWVLGSAVFSAAAFISRAYRWNLLIQPLGYSASLGRTTASLMVGYLANLGLPRLGELARCATLNKAEAIPFNPLLGTVIIERVVDVISLLICLLLVITTEGKALGAELRSSIVPAIDQLGLWIKLSLVLAVAGGGLFFVWRYLKSRDKDNKSFLARLVDGVVSGLKSIAKLEHPWLFLFHSILIWVLYYLGGYFCLLALPSTSQLGYHAALFTLAAGGLGMSAPVQGGIGTYHLFVSRGLMLYGLSQQDGLAFATLLHSLQTLLVIVFGAASLVFLSVEVRSNQRKQEAKRNLLLETTKTNYGHDEAPEDGTKMKMYRRAGNKP